MIAALAAGYVAIGLVLAAIALRRRARALELLALIMTWPLYAPLWLERPPAAGDRAAVLAAALDRVGGAGLLATSGPLPGLTVSAAEAPHWLARIDAAAAELAALDRALATHAGGGAADRPVLRQAWTERRRRHDALAAIDALFVELAAQVGLASWVGDADTELARLVGALDAQLARLDPARAAEE